MNIQRTETIERHADAVALVGQRDALLNESFAADTRGTWDYATDEYHRPRLTLSLSDPSGSEATGAFAPYELKDDSHFVGRLDELRAALAWIGRFRARVRLLYDEAGAWSQALPGGATVREEPVSLLE